MQSQTNVDSQQVHISVRQHHAFGIGAGAAGIEELGQGILVDGCDLRPVWRRLI